MKKFLFTIGMLFLLTICQGQLIKIEHKTVYPFWINLPEKSILYDKPPLLIFLHGKSLSGTDLNRVKRYGVLSAIEKGRKTPAIVIAPQLVNGSWDADKVFEIVKYVQKQYPIDSTRIYVCGMSLGGYGALTLASKYHQKITAAVSICGGGYDVNPCNLAKVPLWILHGNLDKAVALSESQKVVNSIKKCDEKANLKFTIIAGGTHSSVENLFHQDAIYDWLFAQKK